MTDKEMVIQHFQDAIEASGNGAKWRFVRLDIIEKAISLLNEQDALLKEQEAEIREKNQRIWELLCERDSDDGR